uniref:Putative secreted protein n=1 Tax=Ixodes ricinus TaxID=34613 RepID=A0A6B0UP84_IXORI
MLRLALPAMSRSSLLILGIDTLLAVTVTGRLKSSVPVAAGVFSGQQTLVVAPHLDSARSSMALNWNTQWLRGWQIPGSPVDSVQSDAGLLAAGAAAAGAACWRWLWPRFRPWPRPRPPFPLRCA